MVVPGVAIAKHRMRPGRIRSARGGRHHFSRTNANSVALAARNAIPAIYAFREYTVAEPQAGIRKHSIDLRIGPRFWSSRAWLRIFVVRCSLPCDPPAGGHSCNGGMIPRFQPLVISGSRVQSEQMFSGLPPKADLPNLRITPAASFARMPPSRPRALAHNRVSVCDLRDGRR